MVGGFECNLPITSEVGFLDSEVGLLLVLATLGGDQRVGKSELDDVASTR